MIEVSRTFSISDIEKVIYHPKVINLSTENGRKSVIDTDSICWLGVYLKNNIVGLFAFEPLNKVTLDTHCYFLPEYRKKISKEAYVKSVKWVFRESTYKKLFVKCNQKHWHVKNFCLGNGFRLEGKLEKSAVEKGRLVDEYILGMTKKQFLEYINV